MSQTLGVAPAAPPADSVSGLESACELVAGILRFDRDDAAYEPSAGPGSELEFAPSPGLSLLGVGAPAPEVWAVDGGQALVADARTVTVVAVRSARACWRSGDVVTEAGPVELVVLGTRHARDWLGDRGLIVGPDTAVDVSLLRDWAEWSLLSRCVEEAAPGAIVLLDGDLAPDWRVPAEVRMGLLDTASERGVSVVGVTKHSSLALGLAPMVGVFEHRARATHGDAACWWSEVATVRRAQRSPGLLAADQSAVAPALVRVCIARLDRLAPFAFRIDVGGAGEPEEVLVSLRSACNDAAFPGYPFPLSIADSAAACSGWVRAELWAEMCDELRRRGVDQATIERTFADRHHLMERS